MSEIESILARASDVSDTPVPPGFADWVMEQIGRERSKAKHPSNTQPEGLIEVSLDEILSEGEL